MTFDLFGEVENRFDANGCCTLVDDQMVPLREALAAELESLDDAERSRLMFADACSRIWLPLFFIASPEG